MLVDFWLLLVLQHHRPRPLSTVFTSYVLCEARYGVRSKLATTGPLSDNHDEKWQFQLPPKLVKWLCVGWLVAVAPLPPPAVCCPVACCHQAMSPHCLRCLKLGVIHRRSSSLQTWMGEFQAFNTATIFNVLKSWNKQILPTLTYGVVYFCVWNLVK